MDKKQVLKQVIDILKAAKKDPQSLADLNKARNPLDSRVDNGQVTLRVTPKTAAQDHKDMHRGVKNIPDQHPQGVNPAIATRTQQDIGPNTWADRKDTKQPSFMGHNVGQKNIAGAKEHARSVIRQLKQMPKANLPKSEDSMNKTQKSLLDQAKDLLKAAKENPAEFEKMEKSMAAPAPAPKPAAAPKMPTAAKPAAPKPATMQMKAPMGKEELPQTQEKANGGQMSKDELPQTQEKANGGQMSKEEMGTKKCGYMKMSKEEIQADVKKEWKPKFKKD